MAETCGPCAAGSLLLWQAFSAFWATDRRCPQSPKTSRLAPPAVRVVKAPAGCFVPDVIMDGKGHAAHGLCPRPQCLLCPFQRLRRPMDPTDPSQLSQAAWSSRWATRSEARRRQGWHDPRCVDRLLGARRQAFVRYARSLSQGKSFEPVKTLSSTSGNDGVTMTADGARHVAAFWHVANPPQPKFPRAPGYISPARPTMGKRSPTMSGYRLATIRDWRARCA